MSPLSLVTDTPDRRDMRRLTLAKSTPCSSTWSTSSRVLLIVVCALLWLELKHRVPLGPPGPMSVDKLALWLIMLFPLTPASFGLMIRCVDMLLVLRPAPRSSAQSGVGRPCAEEGAFTRLPD